MRHIDVLSMIKDKLSVLYDHTRCPVCMFVIDVDGNGNMISHGSGSEPCVASGRNDEEVADELDRALAKDRQRAERDAADLRAER